MKTWQILAIVLTVAIAVVGITAAGAVAMMNGRTFLGYGSSANNGYGYTGNMMSGYGYGNGYSGGMMGGAGGMMGGYAYNQQGTGCGVHGQYYNYAANATNPISINTALTNAQNYITGLNNPDLAIKQIEEYSNNFYVQVTEKSTGNGALELLVNRYTGAVLPEMGPNMMWNTKYGSLTTAGMMGGAGGMMGGYNYQTITPTTTMTVTMAQATANAQQFLTANQAGTTTGDLTTFYGYYTIEVLQNGNPSGMLSVNGYTGQVWYHNWHGSFVQELIAP